MLVYIEEHDEWYDSSESPIMLHLSRKEKKSLANMPREHERFLSCPPGTSGVKQNQLLQIPPPISGPPGNGLDDLDISGIARVDND